MRNLLVHDVNGSGLKEKILIVDDDQTILSLLERTLRKNGYEALTAISALDALVALQDNKISVLITDLKMPGMNGLDLIKQAQEINPDVPIIVITGYGDYETAVEALDRGAFYFLNKPFNMSTILDVVKKGICLPRGIKSERKAISYTTRTLDFSIPVSSDSIGGASWHASSAASDMGYSKRCCAVVLPLIINELQGKDLAWDDGKGKSRKLAVKILIASEKIVIDMESEAEVFSHESYPIPLEDIDLANEQTLGMMMTRHFADELIFSEDEKRVRVVLYNKETPQASS